MQISGTSQLEVIYPICRTFLEPDVWNGLLKEFTPEKNVRYFEELIAYRISEPGIPEFLPGLARLEYAIFEASQQGREILPDVDRREINPSLSMIESTWKNFLLLTDSKDGPPNDSPERGEARILVWCHPKSKTVQYRAATDEDLLVLKIVTEDIDLRIVAAEGKVPIIAIEDAIDRAIENGLILEPSSLIRRERGKSKAWESIDEQFIESSFFTIHCFYHHF